VRVHTESLRGDLENLEEEGDADRLERLCGHQGPRPRHVLGDLLHVRHLLLRMV